ncbi:MAG: hypothetical protein NC824_06040, partial [Candidatus Omnitrophica bacterium]|nr:hypothetical protein [Candidatus Omnitrophota bacterium]
MDEIKKFYLCTILAGLGPVRTKKLLEYYQIKKPLFSYHQHSKITQIELIKSFFKKEKNLALVCDAGTPGISDPGGNLVALALR